jgi:hypothetical protein
VEDAAAAIGPALVEGLSGGGDGDGVGGGGGGGGCGRTRAVGVALYTLPLVASLGEGEGAEEEVVDERAVVLAAVGQRGVARAHLGVGGEEEEVRGGGRAIADVAGGRGSGRRLNRLLLLRGIKGFRASMEGRQARWRHGNEARGVGEKRRWWRAGRWRRSEMGGGTRWEAGREEERPEG